MSHSTRLPLWPHDYLQICASAVTGGFNGKIIGHTDTGNNDDDSDGPAKKTAAAAAYGYRGACPVTPLYTQREPWARPEDSFVLLRACMQLLVCYWSRRVWLQWDSWRAGRDGQNDARQMMSRQTAAGAGPMPGRPRAATVVWALACSAVRGCCLFLPSAPPDCTNHICIWIFRIDREKKNISPPLTFKTTPSATLVETACNNNISLIGCCTVVV